MSGPESVQSFGKVSQRTNEVRPIGQAVYVFVLFYFLFQAHAQTS